MNLVYDSISGYLFQFLLHAQGQIRTTIVYETDIRENAF